MLQNLALSPPPSLMFINLNFLLIHCDELCVALFPELEGIPWGRKAQAKAYVSLPFKASYKWKTELVF